MHRIAGAVLTLVLSWLPTTVCAQQSGAVGARALGMAGAFTAVADDATAVYWNPAGLATGAFASVVLDHQVSRRPRAARPVDPAAETKSILLALAMPAAGLGYYRLDRRAADGEAADGPGRSGSRVWSLTTDNLALALVHTLAGGLVVGGTVRYVRAAAADGTTVEARPAARLARAGTLEARTAHAVDADLGLALTVGWLRTGVTARNLSAPVFETPAGDRVRVGRHVRAGVAVVPNGSWRIALDADVSRPADLEREVAVGVERWFGAGRVGLRGGLRADTASVASAAAAGGLSIAVRPGLWVEVHASRGARTGGSTWGVAGRAGF